MNISIDNEKDIFIMKLLNYFITKKNYSPIIIHGVDNEIWLENPNEEYKVIRIVTRNIFNDEQGNFDSLRSKHILKQLRKKMLTINMNALTIYTNVGDNYNFNKSDDRKYQTVVLENEEDVFNNDILNKYYSDIKKNLIYDEQGYELMSKITSDISKKNIKESEKRNSMFKKSFPILTYIFIMINIGVYMLMYTKGKGSENIETLINFGAIYNPLVKSGQYYRIITSAFVHIGMLHLLCNMYSLFIIGPQIEQFYGKIKYFIIYFFSIIMGSLFTIVLSNTNTVSAGASGAIFGLLGSLLYFGIHYRGYIGNSIVNQVLPILILNLFITFSTPHISAPAHIGGLIGGYLISYSLGANLDEDSKQKVRGLGISIILIIFLIYMGFFR